MSASIRSRSTFLPALLLVLAGSACAGDPIEPADLVLLGGNVVTVDDRVLDGTALAARGGRVIAVGTDAEIRNFVGEGTEVVELAGRTAIPGFIEGHGHYTGVGRSTLQLNLMDVANWDEVVAMVQAAVAQAQPGELITGRRVAPGEVGPAAGAQRRRSSLPRVPQRRVARQPCNPDARQRACDLRQREGHGTVGNHPGHSGPRRRRARAGPSGQPHRRVPGDGFGPAGTGAARTRPRWIPVV